MRTISEDKIIQGLLASTPALIALFVFPYVVRCFDYSKGILLNILLILSIALGLFAVFYRKKLTIYKDRFTSKGSLIILSIFIVIFCATIFSEQHLNSIWGSYERGMGLVAWLAFTVYFYLLLTFFKKDFIEKTLKLFIWTGGVIGAYGIAQHFGFDPIFKNFQLDFLEGRIFSSLGNPDFLAQFLAPLIFLGIFFIWKRKTWSWILPSGLMTWALLYTESRASFLALFSVLALTIFISIKNKKRILLILSGLLAIFVLLVAVKVPLFERFNPNQENFRSMESRFNIWNIAVQTIVDHPILGIGPDNFSIYFPEYMTPEFYTLEENINISADRAHNEILDMGTIGGIPLILLYLSLIFWVIWAGIYKSKKTLSRAIAFTILVMILQNQLSFPQITHYILFFFLIAMLVIENSKENSLEWRPSNTFRFLGIPLATIFLVFIFLETVKDRVYAEFWYTYALATEDTKEGLKNAIAFDPTNTGFRYNLLMWFPEERTNQLSALRKIEGDTIEVMAWTANDLLSTDTETAYQIFEDVIALNPLYLHTQRAYADGLYINGDYALATEHYELFLSASPDFWKWCPTLDAMTAYEQKKYRIFYKNVPDFNNGIAHLYDSYIKSGQEEKAFALDPYIECFIAN
ncbi:MAG: O-antigen ligase family protein [Candidatus Gracilibacteria bacterium]